MRILPDVLRAVEDHARRARPEECCGLLLTEPGRDGVVTRLLPARNVAGRRARQYVLGHEAHLRAVAMECAGRARVVGYYHSHPDGPAEPSRRDLADAVAGAEYLIVGLAGGRASWSAWRRDGDALVRRPLEIEEPNMTTHTEQTVLGSDPALRRYEDIRELIGSPEDPTPLVRLRRVPPSDRLPIYLKLEWFNPFGSIKDRTALFLLRGMQRRGELAGKRLVEPTSGNTGIGLAALAALMGIPLTVTIPDGVPEEKKLLLRMLGAEVWATPDDLCPVDHPKDGAIALAHSFVTGEATRGQYAMPNQYENPDNVAAHYQTTGPEIWRQTDGRVRYFLAGLGTCGTITGVGRFLKEQDPTIQVIAIEPQKGHRIPGMKNLEESKAPGIFDRSVIDRVVRVDDPPAYAMTKRLFREEGLIVGPSTGAIVHAAVQLADTAEGLAVAVSPDSGFKYASFFQDLLGEEGLPKE